MNNDPETPSKVSTTTRERRRADTRARIADVGVALFRERGFDGATLDDIAEAAGVSRRTVLNHFETKDAILLSLQVSMGARIIAALERQETSQPPLTAIAHAMVEVCGVIPAEEMLAIDRLMRSSAVVQARKHATYVEHEATLSAAIRAMWPRMSVIAVRLTAMIAIGALRLSSDTLHRENGARPFGEILRETFRALEDELSVSGSSGPRA